MTTAPGSRIGLLLAAADPDPILAETVQLRAELAACRRRLAARTDQLERTYAQLVQLRAAVALLAEVAAKTLVDFEGPDRG